MEEFGRLQGQAFLHMKFRQAGDTQMMTGYIADRLGVFKASVEVTERWAQKYWQLRNQSLADDGCK